LTSSPAASHGTLTIGVTNDIALAIQRDNPEWDDLCDR
jgi:hypothetical protein